MFRFSKGVFGTISLVAPAVALSLSATACTGEGYQGELDGPSTAEGGADSSQESTVSEFGTLEQGLLGLETLFSSCGDPGGTESVLAALAVSTATELHRWQPTSDLQVKNGMLVLSSTGKSRCSDGMCFNTQALLDLQKDAASNVQVRPGISLIPGVLRFILTANFATQSLCTSLHLCSVPAHELRLLYSQSGGCDTNYYFEAVTPTGSKLSAASALKKVLLWADVDVNSYIKFQSAGNVLGIDPTYGLNETGSTSTGSCSAACAKVSSTDVSGQCCSCNGTKRFARSGWNANTYLCQ